MQLLAPVSAWYLPAGQEVQPPLPLLLYVPALHAVHLAAPTEVATVPPAQGMHRVAPEAPWYEPALHLEHREAPAKEVYEPGLQREHCPDPALAANCPLGQAMHLALPGGANLPAAQGTQGPARDGTVPALQAEPHPAAPVDSEAEPGVPSAQLAHLVAPALAAKVVAAHLVHCELPEDAENEPGLQGVHLEAPRVENDPAGHCLHERPSAEKNPGRQDAHTERPVMVDSEPGKQRAQPVLPLAP